MEERGPYNILSPLFYKIITMESKKNFIYIILILIQWNLCIAQSHIALDGDWAYRLDSADVGLEQRWFCQNFSDVLYLVTGGGRGSVLR